MYYRLMRYKDELVKQGGYHDTELPVAHHLRHNYSHDTAHRLWTVYDYRRAWSPHSNNNTITQHFETSYAHSQHGQSNIAGQCAILPVKRYDHRNPEKSEQPDHLFSRPSDELLGYTSSTSTRSATDK